MCRQASEQNEKWNSTSSSVTWVESTISIYGKYVDEIDTVVYLSLKQTKTNEKVLYNESFVVHFHVYPMWPQPKSDIKGL